MALPGAAQCGRNPAHGALAGVGAGGADDCGGAYSLDGAGARVRVFALAVLAADGVLRACGGGDVAVALPAAVDKGFSSGGARGGHRVAGADLNVRDGAAGAILSILRVRDGGGGVSLGAVGDGGYGGDGGGTAVGRSFCGGRWGGNGGGSGVAGGGGGGVSLGAVGDGGYGGYGGGTAVGRSFRGARWAGTGVGSVVAGDASAAAGCKRAGTGSATAVHEFGVSDCARIFAGLHVGEPEESAGGARCDHAR